MALGGRNAGVLAIPGSIIVMVGLILLLQNWLAIWETWAYAWTLIVCAVGLGIAFFGMWSDQPDLRNSGWSLARLGLVLFVVFGVLFEFIFSFGSGVQRLKSPFWPVLLIVVGLGLLLYRSINLLSKRSKTSWDDRDLFWPVLFAGFGVLWLLVNLKYLPLDNMGVLIGLWPVLLMAAGLDLMVGRRWPLVGALLGGLVAAGLLWFAINVDRLQLDTRFPTLLRWEDFTGGNFNTERVIGSGVVKEENRAVEKLQPDQHRGGRRGRDHPGAGEQPEQPDDQRRRKPAAIHHQRGARAGSCAYSSSRASRWRPARPCAIPSRSIAWRPGCIRLERGEYEPANRRPALDPGFRDGKNKPGVHTGEQIGGEDQRVGIDQRGRANGPAWRWI